MRKLLVAVLAALGIGLSAGAGSAGAQFTPYGPSSYRPFSTINQPTLSPYLNLLRGGDPAANLYMGVFPEFQRRNFENAASFDINALDRTTTQTQNVLQQLLSGQLTPVRTLPPTGHPTAFQNYGSYFSGLNTRR